MCFIAAKSGNFKILELICSDYAKLRIFEMAKARDYDLYCIAFSASIQ